MSCSCTLLSRPPVELGFVSTNGKTSIIYCSTPSCEPLRPPYQRPRILKDPRPHPQRERHNQPDSGLLPFSNSSTISLPPALPPRCTLSLGRGRLFSLRPVVDMWPLSLSLRLGRRLAARALPDLSAVCLLLLRLRWWLWPLGTVGGRRLLGRGALGLLLPALVLAPQGLGFQFVPVAVEVLESIAMLSAMK